MDGTEAVRGRILVFARAPLPGEAKTRLIPVLGAEGAARFHAVLARRTLETATARGSEAVELWCAPDAKHPFFRDCAREYGVALKVQAGADLGARMHHALAAALQRSDRAVLIGTDCPALTPVHLEQAMASLDQYDAVITPAVDGGYVLIGLRRNDPRLFDDISWGSAEVMAQTRARLQSLRWRWLENEPLPDIDEPEDLKHWNASPDAYP